MAALCRILPLVDPKGEALKAPWLEARKITAGLGGLPSIFLLDAQLGMSGSQGPCSGKAFWSRHVLAHPTEGSTFAKADAIHDHGGLGQWILPANRIPKEAFKNKDVGLLIEPIKPTEIEVEAYPGAPGNTKRLRVILHPESVRILPDLPGVWDGSESERPAVQLSGLGSGDSEPILRNASRGFKRSSGLSIAPLAYCLDGKSSIQANWHYGSELVASIALPEQVASVTLEEELPSRAQRMKILASDFFDTRIFIAMGECRKRLVKLFLSEALCLRRVAERLQADGTEKTAGMPTREEVLEQAKRMMCIADEFGNAVIFILKGENRKTLVNLILDEHLLLIRLSEGLRSLANRKDGSGAAAE